MPTIPAIAYVAEGKLYLKNEGQAPHLIESPFVDGLIDRATRDRQRNEWKSAGMAWQFTSRSRSPFGAGEPPAEVRRHRFSGVSRGNSPRELLYALDTDYVGGLFSHDLVEKHERRIFHRNKFVAADLARHPRSGMLAFSLRAPDGSANLAVMEAEGRGLKEITEGDSVDEAPSWVDSDGKVLVFQSAGIGRNAGGGFTALSPYAIQKLDFDSGDLTTLLELEAEDCLLPRLCPDGTLFFLRRPYQPHGPGVSPLRVLQDVLLFPFRVGRAMVHFLNFFSVMFSKKPILTAGGPPREGPDARQLMLWGKMIDASKALRESKQTGSAALVPQTWELVRRDSAGNEQILAKGILGFDLCPDGAIVYTNGSAVFHLPAGGTATEVCSGKMIERVVVAG